MAAVRWTQNPNLIYLEDFNDSDDSEEQEVFTRNIHITPRASPRPANRWWHLPAPSKASAKVRKVKSYVKWTFFVGFWAIFAICVLVKWLKSSNNPENNQDGLDLFLNLLLIVLGLVIGLWTCYGLCRRLSLGTPCFEQDLKVSRVLKTNHPDEYIDIDY